MLASTLGRNPNLDMVLVEVYWRRPRPHLLGQIGNYGMKVKIVNEPF